MNETLARALPGEHITIAMDAVTEPFWLSAREGRLVAPRCDACGEFRMPPSPFCPHCRSQAVDWVPLSGRGELFSFTVCRRSPFAGVADFTYVPAVVALPDAGGVRLVSNIVGIAPEAVAIGMALQVDWHDIRDGWRVPLFRPPA